MRTIDTFVNLPVSTLIKVNSAKWTHLICVPGWLIIMLDVYDLQLWLWKQRFRYLSCWKTSRWYDVLFLYPETPSPHLLVPAFRSGLSAPVTSSGSYSGHLLLAQRHPLATNTTMAWWIIKPIVAVSAIAVSTLGLLSTKYQKARFYLNLGLYSGTLGIWSIWGVVVSILATAAGHVSYRPSSSRSYRLHSAIWH